MSLIGAINAMESARILGLVQSGAMSHDASAILLGAAQRNHPRKTGESANAMHVSATPNEVGGFRLELRGRLLSAMLIAGTKPHVIEVRGNVLHWTGGKYGPGDHFAARVHHPGTRKNDWRPKAVFAARPEIIALGMKQSRYLIGAIKKEMAG